jgi:hypothetical protein
MKFQQSNLKDTDIADLAAYDAAIAVTRRGAAE